MGLDITAYRGLRGARNAGTDLDGSPVRYEKYVRLCANESFPGRDAGIPNHSCRIFSWAEKTEFRAGSYGGYNEWREQLARLAGYLPNDDDDDERKPYSDAAWRATGGPFHELISFSDCEGVIGPVVAAKLAKDFAEFDERAKALDAGPWFYKSYQQWRAAFEMASDGGAVEFH